MKRINRAQRFIQAYATTPWRRQVQVIGLFSAFVVVVALVASAYLWVSSLAATYGRQVQEIQSTASVLEDNIEDLSAHLGELTTTERMQKLAEEQGYEPITPWDLEYLVVSGYPEEQLLSIAPENQSLPVSSKQELPHKFTQSLFDWVRETIFKIGLNTGASQPDGGGR